MSNGNDAAAPFFALLAAHRAGLGLPLAGSEEDDCAVAALVVGSRSFVSRNRWLSERDPPGTMHERTRSGGGLNHATPVHAEGGAFNLLFFAQDRVEVAGDRAVLVMDKEPCEPFCRRSGGVSVLATRAGFVDLFVIWRSAVGAGMYCWTQGTRSLAPTAERPPWVDEVLREAEAGLEEEGRA